MARGIKTARGTISANTDTTLVAAPGVGETIYVLFLTITVSIAGTASRVVVTNGLAGDVLARLATATADAILNINYTTQRKDYSGRALTSNTALVATTSGTGAATIEYDVTYEVR